MRNLTLNKILLVGASGLLVSVQALTNVAVAQDFDVFYTKGTFAFKGVCHASSLKFDTAKNTLTANGFTGAENCQQTSVALDAVPILKQESVLEAGPFKLRLTNMAPQSIPIDGLLVGETGKNVQVVVVDDLPSTVVETPAPAGFVNTACTTSDNNASVFQCDKNVVIFNPNEFNDTPIPGCVGKESSQPKDCRDSGSIGSETYAMRFDFKGFSDTFNASKYPYRPVNLITLDDMAGVDAKYKLFIMAISEKPGDFVDNLPNKNCSRIDAAGSITINIAQANVPNTGEYCQLTAGKRYYINVRPKNASCIPSDKDPAVNCRVDISANLPIVNVTTFTAPKSAKFSKGVTFRK